MTSNLNFNDKFKYINEYKRVVITDLSYIVCRVSSTVPVRGRLAGSESQQSAIRIQQSSSNIGIFSGLSPANKIYEKSFNAVVSVIHKTLMFVLNNTEF